MGCAKQFGVTPGSLQWLPGAQANVFTESANSSTGGEFSELNGKMKPAKSLWNTLAASAWIFALHCESFAQQPAGQAPNLLKNPTFEKGTESWAFSAWRDRVAKAVKDPNVTHVGHSSIRIDQPKATDSSLTQAVTLKPETRYRLSGWIKTNNVVKPAIEKQRPGEEGASLTILGGYEKTASVIGTEDWMHVSMDFTTKAKTDLKLGPRLGHYGKLVTGTAWFADISLVELR